MTSAIGALLVTKSYDKTHHLHTFLLPHIRLTQLRCHPGTVSEGSEQCKLAPALA